ncbi:hypothetical protein AJ80_06794 [Polytolypa hystricis UAMH7299]|uniref:Uncharacterized protein n=1 Tax=Polytolypa hystricis (strain UAMH7299) TaxID=1447883 RepID=A0A2B7XTH1_POLH7|nr:hypothetical protein AJ80_06794 [Polytolypa hystricis UAMH7299]
MATIRSLGCHEPSAIPYLVWESLLPANPPEYIYTWKTSSVNYDPDGSAEEEILFTNSCVVWSRGGVVKRSFRFDIEKEDVVQALFATFPTSAGSKKRSTVKENVSLEERDSGQAATAADGELQSKLKGKKRQKVTIQAKSKIDGVPDLASEDISNESELSRALVVVLKSQAHIFFLSGDSHIVPLPFEVDSVWPTPSGLLIQRKVDENRTKPLPSAPPNSFASSQTVRGASSFTLSGGSAGRPSLTISPAQPSKLTAGLSNNASLPRIFSLMEPHSEMGLVVANHSASSSTRAWDVLDPEEEILYVSSIDEISTGTRPVPGVQPLILVVTLNGRTGLYTIWSARYMDKTPTLPQKKRRMSSMSGVHSKRRTSHLDLATGATTPVGRGPSGMRESFGSFNHGRGISNTFNQSQGHESRPEEAEDLASQLGPDFGDIGIPLKASRRVSSLLARSDLAAANDRTTFSELATGNQAASSIHGGGRRGDSLGGYSARASFGFNRRSSVPPGNASVYSTGSSFLDAPVDKLLESLNTGGDFEGFENMALKDTMSTLPKEMTLVKVESFSSGFSTPRSMPGLAKSRKFEVFTLSSVQEVSSEDLESIPIAVCILNRNSKNLTVVNLLASRSNGTSKFKPTGQKSKKKATIDERRPIVRATEVRHGSNVTDCCKVVDGDISRMLVLSTTIDGRGELTLQAPWSSLVKVDLPPKMMIHEPYGVSLSSSPSRPREGSLKRVISDPILGLSGLLHSTNSGKVTVLDNQGRKHRIQIQLEPRNPAVKRVLSACRFMLQHLEKAGDGIMVCWWEVLRWLRTRNIGEDDLEWTALVVTLFTMAVYFIEGKPKGSAPRPRRRKAEFLRSSSGSSIDLEHWDTMLDQEAGPSGVSSPWMMSSGWGWISEGDIKPEIFRIESPSYSTQEGQYALRKNNYLLNCTNLAREFLLSPQGEAASGSEGYLPIAVSRDNNTRRTTLGTILVGLHLLREEQKLSIVDAESSYSDLGLLGPVLAQIGRWLGWKSWTWKDDGYYGTETASMERWSFDDSQISTLDIPPEPFAPPSIFSFIEGSLGDNPQTFPTIFDIVSSSISSAGIGRVWERALTLTPRTLALTGFISDLRTTSGSAKKVELLSRWGLTSSVIDDLPDGINAPLHEAIVRCQASPPISWDSSLLELVDRDDLSVSIGDRRISSSKAPVYHSHDAVRDVHHIGHSTLDMNTISSFDVAAEADRQAITRLIFRDDRRFFEAFKILNQTKASVAECYPEPDWSESDLLEAQKEVVQLVSLRTLSLPTGRAMISFGGRVPLLTEKLPIPSFSLQCIMKPSNVTISADRTAFTEEKVGWAFFHNGASTGLAISKAAKGIDTSWIVYNKSTELTNRHAGFLLALGLNGHLKSLAKWVAFKYLTPKHTMTSIGLLLGLSASYLGTMDTLITRLLSVHVTRMLPPGAAELNLSPLTQTTGIMGIGLLYCNSQHRRMSEIMLSEIENVEEEESSISQEILRDEGYRLAAGFALGFINLAKGKDLKGLRDMHIVERLLKIAVGTKNVDLVHVLDRATAGATIALAIIFLRSNDATIAEKIDIPDTMIQFDYVRPDIFLLRTLARHLIMWDSIRPSHDWIQESLPRPYRRKSRLTTIHRLSTGDMPFFNIVAGLCFALGLRFAGSASPAARDLLLLYLDQFIRICRLPAVNYDGRLTRNSVRNCQDIVALSAAAITAGTGDIAVLRRLRSLHGRFDAETPYGSHMAAHMAIGMLFLGGGTYTLGTSNLGIASLLCAFYPVFPTTVLDNKCHLQAFRHLWVLAAEPRCLIPRDLDSRRAVTVPVSLTLKTGETKKTTAPCLLPNLVDLATVKVQSPDHWNLTLDFTGSEVLQDKFRSGDQSVYLRKRAVYHANGSSVFSSTLVALSDAQDITTSTTGLILAKTASPPGGASPSVLYSPGVLQPSLPGRHLWEWIFNLDAFSQLDTAERSLLIPSAPLQQVFTYGGKDRAKAAVVSSPAWLRSTVVDTRLFLERTVQILVAAATGQGAGEDAIRDRLWQLRLLFGWLDATYRSQSSSVARSIGVVGAEGGDDESAENSTSEAMWLRNDIIEDARWKVWGVQAGDDGMVMR